MIPNWLDPKAKVTEHFTVHDCCYLPSWDVYHLPSRFEQYNLMQTCLLLEEVRALVKAPIIVHCMIRPRIVECHNPIHDGQDYNAYKGGAKESAHIVGLAADFDVPGTRCDDLRTFLLPHLESLQCRMEDRPGSNWVHLDLRAPGSSGNRFFKP